MPPLCSGRSVAGTGAPAASTSGEEARQMGACRGIIVSCLTEATAQLNRRRSPCRMPRAASRRCARLCVSASLPATPPILWQPSLVVLFSALSMIPGRSGGKSPRGDLEALDLYADFAWHRTLALAWVPVLRMPR